MPEIEMPHVDVDHVTEIAGIGRIPEQRVGTPDPAEGRRIGALAETAATGAARERRAGTPEPIEGARSAVDGLPGDLGALPYEPDAPRTQTRLVVAVGAKPGGPEPRAAHGIGRARRWIRLRRS
ncbi:hypothetical protein [Embleya sp. NPDC050493]|uniref:hypothetical protein n=1 Tax=Embleya sp. NPDC050493 TaxID=3363989 RepID=UPI0037AF5B93